MDRVMQYFKGSKPQNNDHAVCAFIAPNILEHIVVSEDVSEEVRESVRSTLDASAATDKERQEVGDGNKNPHEPDLPDEKPGPEHPEDPEDPGDPEGSKNAPKQESYAPINIYEGFNKPTQYTVLPGPIARRYGQGRVGNSQIDDCYDAMTKARDFYRIVFGWKSIDDKNKLLQATVRYGWNVANAYFLWKEAQIVFGNGNPSMYNFDGSLDLVGHELTHGVIMYSSGLIYKNQSGALNESCADVMGCLLEQWVHGQTVAQADWLLAQDVLFPNEPKIAMRNMKAPGTAYNDRRMGKDRQVAHMKDYINTPYDDGGVHDNSGIPNRAFYLAASAWGGYGWQLPGQTWFATMTTCEPNATFVSFAFRTIREAKRLGGEKWESAVINAWIEVGVLQRANAWYKRWFYHDAV
ncbi:MAG: hypothetical protein Q9170_001136 [Blastenia crenularia]